MQHDKRRNIVEGPPKFGWPFGRGTDLDIGSRPRPTTGDSTVEAAKPPRPPAAARVPPARPAPAPDAVSSGATPLRSWLVQVVVLIALAYHLLGPGAAFLTGGDVGARGLLALVDSLIPPILDIDISSWVIPAAAAWMWQPLLAVGGAALLRLTALNTATRDPLGAVWMAIAATIVDAATWLFVGLGLRGAAFTPEEGEALVTLLKVEAAALLVLFFIVAPRRRKRPDAADV